MRALLSLFLTLIIAGHLSADAVAGKTHILLEGRQPFWIPIDGGRAIPLSTQWGLPVAAAYDGENFLVLSGAEGYRVIAAMYAEGARDPFRVLTLETQHGGANVSVIWDGTRYVAAWSRTYDPVRGATITRDGIVTHFDVPSFRIVSALASNGSQIAVLEERLIRQEPRTRTIETALLGSNLAVQDELTLNAIAAGPEWAHNQPHLYIVEAIAFGDGFYVVESRGDGNGNNQLIGSQVRADGTIVNRSVLDRSSNSTFNVDLIPSRGLLMAVMIRSGSHPVTATFIGSRGTAIGPQPISPVRNIADIGPEPMPSAVRLPNGRLALVEYVNGMGVVTPLSDSPRFSWRRRSVPR